MTKKMTRKEALEFAIDNIVANCGDSLEECGGDKAIEALQKMINQIDKQAARPKAKTSTRLKNENYARQVIAKVSQYETPPRINAKWISQNIPFVDSSQKGVYVAKILLEWGAFSEIVEKGRKFYIYNEFWEPQE